MALKFPRMVFIGPWDATRHDAVTTKIVADETSLRTALDDGWRLRPDAEDDPEAVSALLAESAPQSQQPVVSQEPKRRVPGRPKRE